MTVTQLLFYLLSLCFVLESMQGTWMKEYVIKSHKTQIHNSPMTNKMLDSCSATDMGSTGKDDGWLQTPVYVTLR